MRMKFAEVQAMGHTVQFNPAIDPDDLGTFTTFRMLPEAVSEHWLPPHDSETLETLQSLHSTIQAEEFWCPPPADDEEEGDPESRITVVTAISSSLINWLTEFDFEQVVDQLIELSARNIASGEYEQKWVLHDSPPAMVDAIAQRAAELREQNGDVDLGESWREEIGLPRWVNLTTTTSARPEVAIWCWGYLQRDYEARETDNLIRAESDADAFAAFIEANKRPRLVGQSRPVSTLEFGGESVSDCESTEENVNSAVSQNINTPASVQSTNTAGFLRVIHNPGEIFEIRAIREGAIIHAAWFDAPEMAALYAQGLDDERLSGAIYVSVNPIDPDQLHCVLDRNVDMKNLTVSDCLNKAPNRPAFQLDIMWSNRSLASRLFHDEPQLLRIIRKSA